MPSSPAAPRGARAWWPGTAAVALAIGMLAGLATPAAAAPGTTPSPPAATSPSSPSPTARHASPGATFGLGPANATKIDGRPYLTYLSAPGAVLTDHVALVNLDTKRVTLNLYTVDATVTPDGRFGYLPRGSARQDAASWMSLRTPGRSDTITLAPRATTIVPVSITIPRDAEPGDHAAGIVTSLTSKITDSQGKQIDFEQRVALRAFFRLSGPLHPQLTVQNLRASYRGTLNPAGGGDVTLTYTVRNLGNVRLGAHQKVDVSGLLGTRAPKAALPDVPLLLPGTAVAMRVTVPDVLPQVRVHARVQLFPLTVAGDVDPGLPKSFTRTVAVWAPPWALLAAVAALLVGVVVLVLLRRRRRRRPPSGRHSRRVAGPDDSGDGAQLEHAASEPERRLSGQLSRVGRGAGVALAAAASVGAAALATAPSALADAVPYTDFAAHGSVGLCDAAGRPITHGSIHDKPFVARAVGSTAATPPYDGPGRRATLVAYQPRTGAYPNQWSGDTLTSSSSYTNPRYPMAQATALDFSLADFLGEFPAHWDGLIQLRIYLGAPGQDTLNSSYPATDIRVTGDTWTVVRGDSVACTNGSAKDSETVRTAPGATSAPATSHAAGKPSTSHPAGTGSAPTAGHATGSAAVSTAAMRPADPAAARARRSSASGWPAVGAAVVAVVAVGGVAGGVVWRRRRRPV